MNLATNKARAYVYSGQWVADCPNSCGNVEYLFRVVSPEPDGMRTGRSVTFFCSYCRYVAEIEWTHDETAIMEILNKRPIPHTRNWYPQGHAVALSFKLPHGQTLIELRDENVENGVA